MFFGNVIGFMFLVFRSCGGWVFVIGRFLYIWVLGEYGVRKSCILGRCLEVGLMVGKGVGKRECGVYV